MHATAESIPVRARLHAALESLDATDDLIREVREIESFEAQRSELRNAAERVVEARELLQGLLLDAA
jgi:hypothetical protein